MHALKKNQNDDAANTGFSQRDASQDREDISTKHST